jgi:uncharacterized protein (DUF983 family)
MTAAPPPASLAPSTGSRLNPTTLPLKWRESVLRGLRGDCPRCGEAPLFRKWLKPVDQCRVCGQDWSFERADDFPAYISIFVTGHLMAPLIIALIGEFGMSSWATLAVILPLAMVMMLGLLQPAKGAVLATMWWSGMGTFERERPIGHPDHRDRQ